MPKIRIEDLTDAQLDHFCAIVQGYQEGFSEVAQKKVWLTPSEGWVDYNPTTNAAQCDEIQERDKIGVYFTGNENGDWIASIVSIKNDCGTKIIKQVGTTAKQAIIRCFIKSKLGDEVDCENL